MSCPREKKKKKWSEAVNTERISVSLLDIKHEFLFRKCFRQPGKKKKKKKSEREENKKYKFFNTEINKREKIQSWNSFVEPLLLD